MIVSSLFGGAGAPAALEMVPGRTGKPRPDIRCGLPCAGQVRLRRDQSGSNRGDVQLRVGHAAQTRSNRGYVQLDVGHVTHSTSNWGDVQLKVRHLAKSRSNWGDVQLRVGHVAQSTPNPFPGLVFGAIWAHLGPFGCL